MTPTWQPTAAFFRHILSEKADAEKIAVELRRHDDINKRVKFLLIDIAKSEATHRAIVQEIKRKIMEEQSRCSHAETRYDADASGGSDSTTECLICGKIL